MDQVVFTQSQPVFEAEEFETRGKFKQTQVQICTFHSAAKEVRHFRSLAGKIIAYEYPNSYITIQFPFPQIYEKYTKCYKILQNYVKVPLITRFDEMGKKVYQQFISTKDHSLTYKECFQYLEIIRALNEIDGEKFDLPILKLSTFIPVVLENLKTFWNQFTCSHQVKEEEIAFLGELITKFAEKIDSLPKTTIYRDLNLTNILRQQTTNQLYLIDYENLCRGPYIIDISFILIDKYFYFDDGISTRTLQKYCQKFHKQINEVKIDFNLCSFYLNLQWLVQMVSLYYRKFIHFHMNLKILLIQLLRSTYRIKKYVQEDEFFKLRAIIGKLTKGFLQGYKNISKIHQLQKLPRKLILTYGASQQALKSLQCSKKAKISSFIDSQKLLKQFKRKCHEIYCDNSQVGEDKIQKQFKQWYTSEFDEDKSLLYEILHETLKKKDEIILINVHKIQIINQIKEFFPHDIIIQINMPSTHYKSLQPQMSNKIIQNQVKLPGTSSLMDNQCHQYSAIILAAGQGSRLEYQHKALINIGGKSLFEHWVDKLLKIGIKQILIADLKSRASSLKQIIQSKYHGNQQQIKIVEVDIAPEPGHTLAQCLPYITKQKVFLISCDTLTNFPLERLCFDAKQSKGVILLQPNQMQGYFMIDNQHGNKVVIQRKIQQGNAYVYNGLCTLNSKQLIEISQKECKENGKQYFPLKQIFMRLISKNRILALEFDELRYHFININEKNDLKKATEMVLKPKWDTFQSM